MKKKNRSLFLAVFLLLCALLLPLEARAADISVFVNGKQVSGDTQPWVNEESRVYVPLRVIAESLGYACSWDQASGSAFLQKGAETVKLTLGSSYYTVNGKRIKGDSYPVAYRGRVMVPVRSLGEAVQAQVQYDAAKNSVIVWSAADTVIGGGNSGTTGGGSSSGGNSAAPPATGGNSGNSGNSAGSKTLAGRTIVLDAGHGKVQPGGWTDPGAVGYYGTPERDIVMDIVYKTAAILQKKGATVILTRAADQTWLTLAGRAAYATKYDADIFISVHCNANENRSYHGTAMYTNAVSYNSYADTLLAQALQKHTVAALGTRDAGLFQGSFGVLRNLPCAGVIAEIGFISNLEEEKKLAKNSFRQKAAEGLAKGIEAYFAAK